MKDYIKKSKIYGIAYLSIVIYAAIIGIIIVSPEIEDITKIGITLLKFCGLFLLSFIISIPLHELGHLVFGLIDGYTFYSFQVLFLKIIKLNNRLKIKVAPTPLLGQCIMNFDKNPKDMKYKAYMYGGAIFNIVFTIIPLVIYILLLILKDNSILFLLCLSLSNYICFISNGIPNNANGIYNDALNLKLMNKFEDAKITILNTLKLQIVQDTIDSVDNIEENLLLNNGLVLSDEFIHKYPFTLLNTYKRIKHNDENKYELVKNVHKLRWALPIMYQYANIAIITFYYLTNDISVKGILAEKRYRVLFKRKTSSDPVINLDLILLSFNRQESSKEDTINKININISNAKNNLLSKVDIEYIKSLTNIALDYVENKVFGEDYD